MYDSVSPGWRGRCTAPLLVDRLERRIISNESADIVVALNALRLPGCTAIELRPEAQKEAMEKLCEQVCADKWVEAEGGPARRPSVSRHVTCTLHGDLQ